MAAVGDLTVLTNVKGWLGIGTATDADANLARLISAVSGTIKRYTSKGILYQSYSEVYNGNGKTLLMLRQLPVVSITSLYLDAQKSTLCPLSVGGQAGYLIEDKQAIRLIGYIFPKGSQNISVTYPAGYQTLNEAQEVPATPFTIDGTIQLGDLWRSDLGVTYADSTALTLVTGVPTVGQYAVSLAGVYQFAAADAGATVLISYNSVPRDLESVVIELVGERYRTKSRIGEVSKVLAGETTSYSQKDMNDAAKLALQQFVTRYIGS